MYVASYVATGSVQFLMGHCMGTPLSKVILRIASLVSINTPIKRLATYIYYAHVAIMFFLQAK